MLFFKHRHLFISRSRLVQRRRRAHTTLWPILLGTLLCVFGAQQVQAQVQNVISTAGLGANGVATGDLDGDGDNDVVSISLIDGEVSWYENLGSGNFGDPGTSQNIIATLQYPSSVLLVDIDGDGDLDVLTSAGVVDDEIAFFENQGSGGSKSAGVTFSGKQVIGNADGALWATTGDLDCDGDPDVLSASQNDDKIAWYENLGGGDFGNTATNQNVISSGVEHAAVVHTADLDGDGDLDVLVGGLGDSQLGANAGQNSVVGWFENLGNCNETKLTASDGATNGFFGTSVSLNGTKALIGAFGDINFTGAAYVFAFSASKQGAMGWTQEAKLTANDGASPDLFGVSVSLDGTKALVGAPGASGSTGAAYVFTFDDMTSTWTQEAKLTASDGEAVDLFGWSVSLEGNLALIGARGDDDIDSESGAAYVFAFDGTTWTQEAKLTATDGAAEDQFGWSVSLNGDKALIGAPAPSPEGSGPGAAYVSTRSTSKAGAVSWAQEAKLTASDGAAEDEFGRSVSLDGDQAMIGAPYDDDEGSDSGTAYVFAFSASKQHAAGWAQEAKLTASDGAAGDGFGWSVSLDGTKVLIGAPVSDLGLSDPGPGAAYVFEENGAVWEQKAKRTATDSASGDQFGVSVSLNGNRALVGAPLDDDDGDDSGTAFVYELGDPIGFGALQTISTAVRGVRAVVAADLNGDGNPDVLSASEYDDKIAWYENQGGGGAKSASVTFGTQQVINNADTDGDASNGTNGDADGVRSVVAADLDGDNDLDVLFASQNDDKIAWYENQGSGGSKSASVTFSTQQVVNNPASGGSDGDANLAYAVVSADLNGAPGPEVLFASVLDNKVGWYENATVLPVELISFWAVVVQSDAVRLTWETASETNNAGFEVHSKVVDANLENDDAAWQVLGFVEGHGTTLEPQHYEYQVEGVGPGRHVFRLKQIDFDGTFEYSPQVEVMLEVPTAFLMSPAYPNPFNPSTSFSLAVARRQPVEIGVYDMLGRRVALLYRGVFSENEARAFTFASERLSSGTYIIRATGKTFSASQFVTLLK